jgi:hypothetical protein
MLTNVLPPQPIPHQPGQRRRKRFDILALPLEVLLMLLKEHLSLVDRAAFALACKAFAQQVVFLPSLVQLSASFNEEDQEEITVFFRNSMKSWFPGHLKYCTRCGKYLLRDETYWKGTMDREFGGRPGKLARKYVVWKAVQNFESSETYIESWNSDGRTRICPRCRLYTRH